MDWQPAYGEVLRRWRKSRGLSQAELAEYVGRVRSTVIGWEKGRHFPAKADIVATLRILQVPPEEFFREVGTRWGEIFGGKPQGPVDRNVRGAPLVHDVLEGSLEEIPEQAQKRPQDEVRPELDLLISAFEAFVARMMTVSRESRP